MIVVSVFREMRNSEMVLREMNCASDSFVKILCNINLYKCVIE